MNLWRKTNFRNIMIFLNHNNSPVSYERERLVFGITDKEMKLHY